jgi:predicted dehydrogenase
MTTLKGVLIGCGMIAREHLGAMSELKNAEMAAVCDLSPARAESTAERFGISKWGTDYERLLAEVKPDLVHITTPPAAHFPIAKTCLETGFNVLCEKPITVEYEQFTMLKELAAKGGRVLMENQNFRFHSSVRRISEYVSSGQLGDLVDVQIVVALNIYGEGSPYLDRNVPHFGATLRGGVVGDFLPHIAYLAHMFIGPIVDLRTTWVKRNIDCPFDADEFRALIKGEHATGYVSFSTNAQPNGFWLRVAGTKMHVEANLYDTPRLSVRRLRSGAQAIASVVNGIAESRDILRGTFGGFWRKLAGTASYDGLPEMIARTYDAIEAGLPQPVPLEDIGAAAKLVDRFTSVDASL